MQSGHCTGSHSVPFFTQLSFVNLVCCLHSIHTFHPLISEDSWPRMYRITDFQTLLLMHRALHRNIMHNALRVLHAHTHRSSQPFKRFFLIVSAVSKLCVWKREEYWQSLKLWWSHEMGARILSSSCWRREELYQAAAINCCTPLQLLWAFSLPPGIHENIVGDHSKQSVWAAASKWRNLFSDEEWLNQITHTWKWVKR